MDQQPTPVQMPPAGAPAKQGIPRWLIIVGVVVAGLGVLCCLAVVLAPMILGPSVERVNLALICTLYSPSADQDACNAWAADVQDTPEYRACRDQAMSGNQADPNLLYECLVEQGLGPE